MASSTSTDILQAIKGKGYWLRDDADIGKRADSILKPRFNIQSVEALELCKVAAFDNEVGNSSISRRSLELTGSRIIGTLSARSSTSRLLCSTEDSVKRDEFIAFGTTYAIQ